VVKNIAFKGTALSPEFDFLSVLCGKMLFGILRGKLLSI